MAENKQPEQQPQKVNVDRAVPYPCPKCGGITFRRTYVMKMLLAKDAPRGYDTLMPTQVFQCETCDHISDKMLEAAQYPKEKKVDE